MSHDDIIGPALPPMFREADMGDSDEEDAPIGPALPPSYKPADSSSASEESDREEVVFKRVKRTASGGSPASSKHRRVENTVKMCRVAEEEDGFFGPALPPGFQKQQSSPERPPVLGPALPPGFQRQDHDDDDDDDDSNSDDDRGVLGPALPPGYRAESSSGEEEDVVIGPMPALGPAVQSSVVEDIERRAKKMKDKLTGADSGPDQVTRETWMTELPPELQHIGLGARTFRKRTGPEDRDRSIWTDTPADRERKTREQLEGKRKEPKKDNGPRMPQNELLMAEKVSKYNHAKRGESLISLHTQKMKQKAEAAPGPVERRPFDRDADLQVNRFDEAQKKVLLKKSQELNTRFSHSKDRMFL